MSAPTKRAHGGRRYGYEQERWDAAKEEIRGILIRRAKTDGDPTISYSDLSAQAREISFQPDSHAFHAMLGEFSSEEDESRRGMLSVLVVAKETGEPGSGFFYCA